MTKIAIFMLEKLCAFHGTGLCFVAYNVVRKGGVSTPILLRIYTDGLLLALSVAGLGCLLGHIFVGVLAYADDIVLLAPTSTATRTLLAVCEGFANEYGIPFNATRPICQHYFPEIGIFWYNMSKTTCSL